MHNKILYFLKSEFCLQEMRSWNSGNENLVRKEIPSFNVSAELTRHFNWEFNKFLFTGLRHKVTLTKDPIRH